MTGEPLEPMRVSRYVYRGMAHLHCSKREMMFMTPREFYSLWMEYLEEHGVRVPSRVAGIDDLP